MADLVITGGTANAAYTPSTGFTAYFDGWVFSDATSIKTDPNEFGLLLENSLTSGDLVATLTWHIRDSGGAGLGPCFSTSAGNGFTAWFTNSSDAFSVFKIVGGSDSTVYASGNISTFVTVADGDLCTAELRYNSTTGNFTLKLNGVTIVASTAYTGGVSSLRGGVAAYNDQYENITALNVSTAGVSVRALVNYSGSIKEIATADVGTGKKPITIYNGVLQEYDGSHATYVILDPTTKVLRQIASGETLII